MLPPAVVDIFLASATFDGERDVDEQATLIHHSSASKDFENASCRLFAGSVVRSFLDSSSQKENL